MPEPDPPQRPPRNGASHPPRIEPSQPSPGPSEPPGLEELIGELNTDTVRNRAKLYTLEALNADPRVKQVQSVIVKQSSRDRTQVDIAVQLLAIDSDTPINFVFPFFLERA